MEGVKKNESDLEENEETPLDDTQPKDTSEEQLPTVSPSAIKKDSVSGGSTKINKTEQSKSSILKNLSTKSYNNQAGAQSEEEEKVSLKEYPEEKVSTKEGVGFNLGDRSGSGAEPRSRTGTGTLVGNETETRTKTEPDTGTRTGTKTGTGNGPATNNFTGCLGEYTSGLLFQKRTPFMHDPPQPEERRPRFSHPRTPREYIINLRENLADFQETHGLPRTRDYSFLSLGLALAQETARAIYSIILMFTELFPILAIVSLILRFALDKLIDILETADPVEKIKKSLIFAVEMIVILIPLWILIGSIVIPLLSLITSMFARILRVKGGKKKCSVKVHSAAKPTPAKSTEIPYFLVLEILSILEKWCLRL